MMLQDEIPGLSNKLNVWYEDLDTLRQNYLLDEPRFLTFAQERGIIVQGLSRGEPGIFHQRGLLSSDGVDSRNEPMFHPFRIYSIHKALNACNLSRETSALLQQDRKLWMAGKGRFSEQSDEI